MGAGALTVARHLRTAGRRRKLLIAGVAAATVATVLLHGGDDPEVVRVPEAATAAGGVGELYVDPSGAAAGAVRELQRTGRHAEAAIIRKIADRPAATWFVDAAPGYALRARRLVTAATEAGRLPVLAFYYIPHRDCAGYSAGGAPHAAAYRDWIANLAAALRGHRALVVLEPDAVAHAAKGCLDAGRAAERYALLAGAVHALRALPGVRVYLDAGNPSWIPAGHLAPALRRAGVARATGVALNVANFQTTDANLRYGTELSRLLGGTRFVIDTSRNGAGPAGPEQWCNPPGRRLGAPPTLRTGHPLADAYLWVKRPGESDGACGNGAPPAGQWFPAYARELARHP